MTGCGADSTGQDGSSTYCWTRDVCGWIVQARAGERQQDQRPRAERSGFSANSKHLGRLTFRVRATACRAPAGRTQYLTEDMLLDELAFLDDPSKAIPPSIPRTSLWLAQAWQQRVLDEELRRAGQRGDRPAAGTKAGLEPGQLPNLGQEGVGRQPRRRQIRPLERESSRERDVCQRQGLTADGAYHRQGRGDRIRGGRLRPAAARRPQATADHLADTDARGYRVVSLTKGVARSIIIAGVALLVLGVAAAIQSTTLFGVTGLIMAGIGGYLIVLGTWQLSSRLLFALLSLTLVGAVLSLATPVVRQWLFGTQSHPGLVGTHAYWLGAQWWHPLIVVGAIALAVTVIAAAKPRRK